MNASLPDRWIYATLCRLADPKTPKYRCDDIPPAALRRMLTIARVHGILGLVLDKLEGLEAVAPEIAAVAARSWRAELVQSLRVRNHGQRLVQALRAAGIPAALIKGPDFADHLYPLPRLRTTTDVDLLIPACHWQSAIKVLESSGHKEKEKQPPFELPTGILGERTWVYRSPPLEIDLHWNMVNLPTLRAHVSVEWQDLRWQSEGVLTPASRLLIASVHATYHHQFDRLLLLVDLLQAVQRAAAHMADVQELVVCTKMEKAMNVSLAITARILNNPEVEELRRMLDLGGKIPEPIYADAQERLFRIRTPFNVPSRGRFRSWLKAPS